MNNEDKILQMLTVMQERFDTMQSSIDTMQDEQKKTNERIDAMQVQMNQRFNSVDKKLHVINLNVEEIWRDINTHDKAIEKLKQA